MATEVGLQDRRGIYNAEYFSGSQAAIYIGDVLVDEITSIEWSLIQQRTPLYGYNDMLYRDISKGRVFVQGQFSVNFKEAGYLWLVLNRYQALQGNPTPLLDTLTGEDSLKGTKRGFVDPRADRTIETVIAGDISRKERNSILLDMATKEVQESRDKVLTSLGQEAQGFADSISQNLRGVTGAKLGGAESIFEAFEDRIWNIANVGKGRAQGDLETTARRVDDPELNPFDIFVSYGEQNASDHFNHTVKKIIGVCLVGHSQVISVGAEPIQETYQFIARNVI